MRIGLVILSILSGVLQIHAQTEPNWPAVDFTQVVSGLNEVVDIQNAADGSNRLFLVQQQGQIRVLKNGVLLPTPLLDVASTIAPYGEQGLLGLAFPPGFAQKKCFYIYYCRRGDNATILSRFQMSPNPDVAFDHTEEILMVTPKSDTNHNGGQLAFGPDGLLYISIGDGGGAGDPQRNSQNLTNRLGKILRIDVENTSPNLPYAIPASNPFATSATRSREILCWGLRNPWRFSFDSLTGDLFIGDVGEQEREEINFLSASSLNSGTNFGWSVKEGTLDFAAQTNVVGILHPPAFEYGRSIGYSVTGGLVYRGANPRLQGFYLFGDFATGQLLAMALPAQGGQVKTLKIPWYGFSTFGKDEAGEIYFADYYGAAVYRINALNTLPPPSISQEAGVYTGRVTVTMSTDIPGAVVRYTTDGTPPSQNSPIFFPGSTVEKYEPFTLKAATFRVDLNQSPTVEAVYQLRPWVEIGGSDQLNNYTSIKLTSTSQGAEIHYTIDGSDPTRDSPLYSGESGILIAHSQILKALAFKEGPGWLPGVISRKNFILAVATPAFSQRFYDLYDLVKVVCATSDATLHYTIDGSVPTLASPVWSTPQHLPSGTKITVLARKGEMRSTSNTLEVAKMSAQKTRFEQVGSGYMQLLKDVVYVNPTTIFAVGLVSIYRLSDGVWIGVPDISSQTGFQSGCFTSTGNLSLVSPGQRSISRLAFTPFAIASPWDCAPAYPFDLVALPTGGFLVVDPQNHRVQKVTGSSAITAFAGTGVAGSIDGSAATATFNVPMGIAKDLSDNVYVSESAGRRIRKISNEKMVTTLAGSGVSAWIDGPATTAGFVGPTSISMDRIGNLYVLEKEDRVTHGDRIRKVRPDGIVTTLYGPTFQSNTNDIISPDSFGLFGMEGIDVDQNGVLYIAGRNDRVFKAIQEDWDNDLIPDAAEVTLGSPFVVGVDDRLVDTDGDLFSNSAEWMAGNDPLLSSSYPLERTQIELRDGTVSLNLLCNAGETNQLEYSDDLHNWKPIGVPSTSAFRSVSSRFATPQFTRQRFYRLRSIPVP